MRMNWLFGGADKPRAPTLATLSILIGALFVRAADPVDLSRLRDFAFDGFQRLKPRAVAEDLPVRIVDIDEVSLAEYGQWPWPRTVLATLIDKLAAKGAAVIAFDVVFAESDGSSIATVARGLPPGDKTRELQQLAASFPDNDKVFAEAIAKAPIVTGFGFDRATSAKEPPRRGHGVAHNSGEANAKSVPDMINQFIQQQAGSVKTIDVLEMAAKGNGGLSTEIDDAVIRRVPMVFRLAGQRSEDLYPSLSAEALRVAQGASTYLIKWSGAQDSEAYGARTGISSIRVGDVNINTDARGRVWLYDSGHIPSRFISIRDVMKGTVPDEKLEASVLFLGTSAIGLKDLRNTPLANAVPGVEVHAQLVEQMLTQTFLERPDYADGAEFLYLAAIGIVFILLLPRLAAGPMALVALVFVGVGIVVPWLAFSQIRLLFDPIYPSVTFATMFIVGSAISFMITEREKRQIRGAFNLYLSPEQVENVARNPKALQLGGEMRDLTVMFTDVRGFTTISEQFDPPGLTKFMNRFLTPMTDLIMAHKGTIDKYMGDAIMAFWNAPIAVAAHARLGCETALAMQSSLKGLNAQWKAEAEAGGRKHIPVNIGVGVNTGPATVGNFGSTQRFTYSCLGDDVNLASRLEGQCKGYGVGIIIGSKTCKEVQDLAVVELDLIQVKGKTEPERIFCLVGDKALAETLAFRDLLARQKAFLMAYRAGKFVEAHDLIAEVEAAAAAVDWQQGYLAMMRVRVEELRAEPPVEWNGIYVAKEK